LRRRKGIRREEKGEVGRKGEEEADGKEGECNVAQ